ncbi:MAG: SDR family oxidoreductase [Proteobacteria bacterium]|nr:SDR family oxidoreductase [Pseudomonadota bacterium]
MDLGLQGRRAIVCAASKGLGAACATALAREGVLVTITGRTIETLEATARAIAQETGIDVGIAAGDIATEAGRVAAFAACPEPDILVNNAGGPPPGDFRDWERADWLRALDANMLAPIAMIKGAVDGMIGRRFGRIVNITSASVKSPIPQLGMSNGARAGLTGFVGGLARQVARHNVTINNLLPGPFVTDRLRTTMAASANQAGRSIEAEIAARAEQNPTGRFGDPEEFGRACAFLCSASAGYIVGQNILLDGGAFNATMG